MRSRNPVYPLPQGVFSVHSNADHNYVSRYKSYSWIETGLKRPESSSFSAMPSPNIPDLTKARQFLLFPTSRIGPFEPSLYGTIMVRYGTIQTHNLASRERSLSHLVRNGQFGWVVEFSFANWEGADSNLSWVTSTSVMALVPSNEITAFQAT